MSIEFEPTIKSMDSTSAWYDDVSHTNKWYVKVKSFRELSRIYYIRTEVAADYTIPWENLPEIKLIMISDFIVNTDSNSFEKCVFNMEELIDKFLEIED